MNGTGQNEEWRTHEPHVAFVPIFYNFVELGTVRIFYRSRTLHYRIERWQPLLARRWTWQMQVIAFSTTLMASPYGTGRTSRGKTL